MPKCLSCLDVFINLQYGLILSHSGLCNNVSVTPVSVANCMALFSTWFFVPLIRIVLAIPSFRNFPTIILQEGSSQSLSSAPDSFPTLFLLLLIFFSAFVVEDLQALAKWLGFKQLEHC